MDHNEDTIGEEMLPLTQNENTGEHPMDALLDAEAYELETPRRGEVRRGTIARITETDILVDVGAKSEGIIHSREIEQLTDEERQQFTVGTQIDVFVVRALDRDGTVLLSLSKAEEEQDWRQVEELQESREAYEGSIAGYNKGGLIVKVGQLRGFVPASQVSISRRRRGEGTSPDQRWGKMVDEAIIVKVIEVDRRRNRLILSEKAASKEARDVMKERLIDELQVGEIRSGHVISLADFGAFVDIGGADGLIHISELSWKRISHPSEVVKVGEEVKVKVLGVDPDRRRISLSLRELEEDPWTEISRQYQEGQLVEGTITKLTKFGAFAYLKGTEEYDIEGLIHISELSDRRVEHPREVVEEGQTVTMRLINVDQERRRIGLSLKRVDSADYSEIDWQTAMQELEEEADAVMQSEEGSAGPVDEAAAEAEVEVAGAEVDLAAEESPSPEAEAQDEPDAEEATGPDAEAQDEPDAEEATGPDAEAQDEPDAEEAAEPDAEAEAEVQAELEEAPRMDAGEEDAAPEEPSAQPEEEVAD
jgi:small subunit ribosomal protein S1